MTNINIVQMKKEMESSSKWMMTVSKAFQSHGEFCASHPWEMIIGTFAVLLTVVSMSMVTVDQVCGWNYHCQNLQDVKSSDIIILTITRCIAVIYIYLQFRNLRKLGSKYLLGIAGMFTIFSSFVFSIAVINLLGGDLSGLNEALPFFLLLVDLSKACALAKFVLSSRNQGEVVDNIGQGMSILGPAVTLDTLVTTLVIGIGTLSGVHTLETMCCFGCLTVVANFFAFMTFYPACLALVFELLGNKGPGRYLVNLEQITTLLAESEKEKKNNPVAQRVKLIMSAGLMIFHTHSRVIAGGSDLEEETGLSVGYTEASEQMVDPNLPLWQFYLMKFFSPGVDSSIATFLGILLFTKYIFFDGHIDKDVKNVITDKENELTSKKQSAEKTSSEAPLENGNIVGNTINQVDATERNLSRDVVDSTHILKNKVNTTDNSIITEEKRRKSVTFSIGADQSDSEDDSSDTLTIPHQDKHLETTTVGTQTRDTMQQKSYNKLMPQRSLEECVAAMKSDEGPGQLSDEEILILVKSKHIPAYKLESILGDHERGVVIRRRLTREALADESALENLPFTNYDYQYVEGACCENVIGYMPVPVGVAGPLVLDGKKYQVPMATTEGCLVASTNRGCRAIAACGGVKSSIMGDGMTRAPVVRFQNAMRATEAKKWMDDDENFSKIKEQFDSTSRFARLKKLHVVQAARNLYIRFVAVTGDAMGMNMLSKGSEKALNFLQEQYFPDMEILSLSGNFCTDKKPSAINWLEGRGKSVVCEAVISNHVIKTVLKTCVSSLVDLNISKNFMGSAMAGSIGGYNAHAANVVTAIYIATGQDPAQNIASSNCMTVMEPAGEHGEDLYISCTMPSIEVGTVGGGTVLPPQSACLKMLGVKGAAKENPGENASCLARVICGTVMAGELSLMSALAAGHLVRSHLRHNRSSLNMCNSSSQVLVKLQPDSSSVDQTEHKAERDDLQPVCKQS